MRMEATAMEARKRELKDFYRTVDPQREKNVEPIFSRFSLAEISDAVMKKYGKIPSGWSELSMPEHPKVRPPLPSMSKKPDLSALRPSNGSPPPMSGINEGSFPPPPGLTNIPSAFPASDPPAPPKRTSRPRSSGSSSRSKSSSRQSKMKPKAPVPPPFLHDKAPPPAAVLSSRKSHKDNTQASVPTSNRNSKRRSKSRPDIPMRTAPPPRPPRTKDLVPRPAAAPKPQPAAASSGPSLERPPNSDPAYDKYKKMKKAGLPQGAVENAMVRDGMDPCGLFGTEVMTVPYTEPGGGGGGGSGGPPPRPAPPPAMAVRAPVLSIAIKPQPPSSKPPKPKEPMKRPEMKAPPVSRPAPSPGAVGGGNGFDSNTNFSAKRNLFTARESGANSNSEQPKGSTQGRSKGPASSILARQQMMAGIFGGATAETPKPALDRPKGGAQKSSALLEKQKSLAGLFGGAPAAKKEPKAFKWAIPTAESAAANAVAAETAQGARPPNPMMGGSSAPTPAPAHTPAVTPVSMGAPAGPPPPAASGGDAGSTYIEMWSDDYNHPYWFNPLTGESLWTKPPGWKPPAASGPVVHVAHPPPPKQQTTRQVEKERPSRGKGRPSGATKGRPSGATKGRPSGATKGRPSGAAKGKGKASRTQKRTPKARPPPSRGMTMVGSYVMAAYDFEPADRSNESEMTLTYGDVIKVTEQGMDGWWEGQRQSDRVVGLFPASYVVPWTQ